ncbi:MAG: hypothetical protein PUP46_02860 [Endozoicomonas sp. (ex Botrylloides leachii)]|nr:hypothetical protein [Endozoicomonas sp. (ex Botrylloides leachii)]
MMHTMDYTDKKFSIPTNSQPQSSATSAASSTRSQRAIAFGKKVRQSLGGEKGIFRTTAKYATSKPSKTVLKGIKGLAGNIGRAVTIIAVMPFLTVAGVVEGTIRSVLYAYRSGATGSVVEKLKSMKYAVQHQFLKKGKLEGEAKKYIMDLCPSDKKAKFSEFIIQYNKALENLTKAQLDITTRNCDGLNSQAKRNAMADAKKTEATALNAFKSAKKNLEKDIGAILAIVSFNRNEAKSKAKKRVTAFQDTPVYSVAKTPMKRHKLRQNIQHHLTQTNPPRELDPLVIGEWVSIPI